jgi:CrcB protein
LPDRVARYGARVRWLAVFVGGGLGATLRYAIGGWVQSAIGSFFPWGTLVVNASGCLAIGVLATLLEERSLLGPSWRLFLLVGVLGGYTTFSSFGLETWRLVEAAIGCAPRRTQPRASASGSARSSAASRSRGSSRDHPAARRQAAAHLHRRERPPRTPPGVADDRGARASRRDWPAPRFCEVWRDSAARAASIPHRCCV